MRVEWDPEKARRNLRKHGVYFADAVIALEDMNAVTVEDDTRREQRFKTLGMGPMSKVLLVVYAAQDKETIRIISARKAGRRETWQYWIGVRR